MSTSEKILGATIRAIRESQGRTQEEIGTRAGLTKATLSRIETGQAGGRHDTIKRIAAALGLTLDELEARAREMSGEPAAPSPAARGVREATAPYQSPTEAERELEYRLRADRDLSLEDIQDILRFYRLKKTKGLPRGQISAPRRVSAKGSAPGTSTEE
ncbi:MAG: helix-turn-helix transcriptional regulator [bacterium]